MTMINKQIHHEISKLIKELADLNGNEDLVFVDWRWRTIQTIFSNSYKKGVWMPSNQTVHIIKKYLKKLQEKCRVSRPKSLNPSISKSVNKLKSMEYEDILKLYKEHEQQKPIASMPKSLNPFISKTIKKLNYEEHEQQKPINYLLGKEKFKPKGISVTATQRKDLDLSKPNIFHKNNCTWLKNVPYGYGIIFENREAAIASHYRPCRVCKP